MAPMPLWPVAVHRRGVPAPRVPRGKRQGAGRRPAGAAPGSETRPGQWRTGGRSGGRLADRGGADERRSTARAAAGSGGRGNRGSRGGFSGAHRRGGDEELRELCWWWVVVERRRRLVGQWKHKLEWASNGWAGKGNAHAQLAQTALDRDDHDCVI